MKKLYFMLILLVCILSVSAASAADHSASDIDNNQITLDESISQDAYNDEELILDGDSPIAIQDKTKLNDGTGTFTDLNETINGNDNATITLDSDYTFDGVDDYDAPFKNGIVINRNLTIDGQGHTLNGNGQSRIFYIDTFEGVTLKNINFINGYVKKVNGSAICPSDINMEYTAINCNFTNNTAEQEGYNTAGGGAMNYGIANYCIFTQNQAYSGGAMNYGIANYCIFTQNQAYSGGAMNYGIANNSIFTQNQASWGGAIEGGTANNCTFTQNLGEYGGAIEYGTANNCTFTQNRANEMGGAMANGIASNCIFVLNIAKEHGGGMSTGTAYDCIFAYNGIENWDGYVVENDWNHYLTNVYNPTYIDRIYLNASDFISTQGSGEKLLFNITSRDGMILNSINTTINITKDGSESIYYALSGEGWTVDLDYGVYDVNLSIENTSISANAKITITNGNSFSDLNKLINSNEDSLIALNKSYTYDPNTDSEFKNGIVISRNLTIDGQGYTLNGNNQSRIFYIDTYDGVTLKNINFINGYVKGADGGAICPNSGYMEYAAINCNFINNTAESDGNNGCGGAMNWGTANNCTFTQNHASFGGAMNGGTANDCIFTQNNVTNYGGAMRSGIANNCTFMQNYAQLGAAMISSTANGCIFTQNYVTDSGGAMYGSTANNCTFTQNYAIRMGGGMYGGNAYDCTFAFNSANTDPDAYGLDVNENPTYISSASISVSDFMTSPNSGEKLMFNVSGSEKNLRVNTTITLYKDGELFGNYSAFSGEGWEMNLPEGIYSAILSVDFYNADVDPVNIGLIVSTDPYGSFWDLNRTINGNENNEITLNKTYTYNPILDTPFKNGIVISRELTIDANGSTIDGNHNARIFYVDTGDKVVFKNANFINGYVNGSDGGAIALRDPNMDCSIINSNFTNNTADCEGIDGGAGGAIYGGKAYDSRFTENQAEYGGAINRVDAYNCTFTENRANYGGAMYNGNAYNSTFLKNNASTSGGASYGGNAYNSRFTENEAEYGGAIFLRQDNAFIGSIFTKNNGGTGGAIYGYRLSSFDIRNNIFLSNGDPAILLLECSKMDMGCNWFGNNASDYSSTPNDYSDTWLFLNATADPDTVPFLNSSNIVFKLYQYNSTKRNVTEFDNGLLYPARLSISAINGDINNSTIIGENIQYTANSAGDGSVTARIEDAEATIFLNNMQIDPGLDVTLDPKEIDYGYDATIKLEYNSYATGTVNITLAGKKYNVKINNTKINETIIIPDLMIDEYAVTVSYSCDGNFTSASKTAEERLKVNQINPNLTVIAENIFVNDTEGLIFTVILAKGATGDLNLTGDIKKEIKLTEENIKDGKLTVEIMNENYPVGKCNVTFSYSGNEVYYNSTVNSIAEIMPINTEIAPINKTINLIIGEKTKVNYTINPIDAIGDVTFTSNDTNIAKVDNHGEITAIGVGKATIIINFSGSENYTSSNATVEINVNKESTELTANNLTAVYNRESYLEIVLKDSKGNPIAGVEIVVDLNGKNTFNTSSNGTVKVPTKGLSANTYDAIISFAGDDNYLSSNAAAKVIIEKDSSRINASDLTTDYHEDSYLIASILDSHNNPIIGVELSVDLCGKNNYITDSNGEIKVPTKELSPKTYLATIIFAGNGNYTGTNTTASVIVNRINTRLNATDVTTTYNANKDMTVSLKDIEGNPIAGALLSVDLNGKKEYTTDSSGQVNVPTKGLSPDNYKAVIVFEGNENYTATNTSASIIVKRGGSSFSYADMNTIAFDSNIEGRVGEYFQFQLLDDNGKPLAGKQVFIGFNGVKYSRTTNETGEARLQINLKYANHYTFAIAFLGDDNYSGSFNVALISVSEQTPSLSTSAKTYKASAKTKVLTATLKSSRGQPIAGKKITFTLNGKVYSGNTNEQGIATVKVSLSKKGTYSFTVQYGGDSTYKKVTKSSKLTIK